MGATGHLDHFLTQKVGGHEGRGQAVVGGTIAQLAVAIVSPGKNLSIYIAGKSTLLFKWLIFYKETSVNKKKQNLFIPRKV